MPDGPDDLVLRVPASSGWNCPEMPPPSGQETKGSKGSVCNVQIFNSFLVSLIVSHARCIYRPCLGAKLWRPVQGHMHKRFGWRLHGEIQDAQLSDASVRHQGEPANLQLYGV